MAADGRPAPGGLIPTLEESVRQKTMIVGSPEEVAEGVQFYKDLLGMERLTIFPHLLGDPYEKADEQMARFMNDVMPLVN
jgi:alkanesulfonate monooxygenase SsuD/methylene tetrahydromethanopterin reductase-like flavin-dependent oxidoreductase (luciferase family)